MALKVDLTQFNVAVAVREANEEDGTAEVRSLLFQDQHVPGLLVELTLEEKMRDELAFFLTATPAQLEAHRQEQEARMRALELLQPASPDETARLNRAQRRAAR